MIVTLIENFRAVFYTPFYAAFALEAFAAEGVDVRLKSSAQPLETPNALAGGAGDVSWGGPMRVMRAYDEDPNCGLVIFCEVVRRDPFFLIGREPLQEFRFPDLLDKKIATVSEVPTPWMCLQDDIRRAGLDPALLERVSDRSMADNAASLRDGTLDAIQVFEPFVEQLVREGTGHIWYAAASRGPTSYTTFYAEHRTLDEMHDTVLAMTRAIYRTLKWVRSRDAATIAETIAGFFPELDADTFSACIARYKALGLWGRDPFLPKEGFHRLKDALLSGGLIERGADYGDCIDTSLAQAVIDSNPPSM